VIVDDVGVGFHACSNQAAIVQTNCECVAARQRIDRFGQRNRLTIVLMSIKRPIAERVRRVAGITNKVIVRAAIAQPDRLWAMRSISWDYQDPVSIVTS
jgi:hypothetical protein